MNPDPSASKAFAVTHYDLPRHSNSKFPGGDGVGEWERFCTRPCNCISACVDIFTESLDSVGASGIVPILNQCSGMLAQTVARSGFSLPRISPPGLHQSATEAQALGSICIWVGGFVSAASVQKNWCPLTDSEPGSWGSPCVRPEPQEATWKSQG